MARLRPVGLVHYHELGLKRGNRPLFLRHLARNLRRATSDLAPVKLRQVSGRLLLDLEDHPDPAAVRDRVRRVCGVASVALAYRVVSTVDAMKAVIAKLIEERTFASFRITARRAFKTYPMTSVELNRELGAFVLERVASRVDLRHPELEIHVEVMPAETFVYVDPVAGPGGLPVGASGTVATLLSGGIDSPVAAWRMMNLPPTSQAKARALVGLLTPWQYDSKLVLVPFGEIQREVVLTVPPPARVVVYRRLMVRIAETLARKHGAAALTTGESLGQVASQTLSNIARIDEAAGMPILRPLIGMDKLEITEEARRLGTFEISVEPDADCCTLFVPKHPATRMSEHEVGAAEARLEIPRLVASGCDGASVEAFEFPAGAPAELGSE